MDEITNQLIQIADLYYNQNKSQDVIAKELFISRSKISRLLIKAREIGIVEITVHSGVDRNIYLEKILKNRLSLDMVQIVNGSDMKEIEKAVTGLAAAYIDSCLTEQSVIGLGRGDIVEKCVDALPEGRRIPIHIVQLLGAMEWSSSKLNEIESVQKFAKKYGGFSHYIFSPFTVKDKASLKALYDIEANRIAFEYASKAEMIINSVGAADNEAIESVWREYLLEHDKSKLEQQEAVGVYCGQYFDIHGKVIDLDVLERSVAVPISCIRECPMRLCIAPGVQKSKAIVGAVRAGFVNRLITDENTALEVLLNDYAT